MDVIWETDELMVVVHGDENLLDIVTNPHDSRYISAIDIGKDETTAFARHWLDLRGYNVVKCGEAINSDKYDYKFALERIRTWTCNDGRGYEDPAALLENIDDYINKVLDVVKREPELLPCPNPECGHSLGINQLQLAHYGDDEEMYWTVECPECGLRYPLALTLDEAIRLYNMIANNALPRKEE
jgi:hypothetical protein